jgi:hypothetical protein
MLQIKAKPADPIEYKKVADEQDNLKRPYQYEHLCCFCKELFTYGRWPIACRIPSSYTKDTYDVLGGISECPLMVFINSRSGGQQGSELTLAFNKSLGRSQVTSCNQHRIRLTS